MLSLFSCLAVRLAVRHQRDDYRDAAQYARQALLQNQVVWWNAAVEGAWDYKMPLDTSGGQKDTAIPLLNPSVDSLARLKKPNVIIVSKPDLFDSAGTMADYLKRGHY